MPIKQIVLKTGSTPWMMPGALDKPLEAALDDLAAAIKVEFELTTKTWDHKPQFNIESSKGRRLVYTDDQHYSWVNYGTNNFGTQFPVNKKALRLPSYQTAKTRTGDIFSYSGNRDYTTGVNIFKSVKISSIKARRFDKAIVQFFKVTGTKQFFTNALNRTLGRT